MKNLSILYKIIPVPGGKHSIRYAKIISCTKVTYTRHKPDAKKVGLFYAIVYAFLYGLSIAYCADRDLEDAMDYPATSCRFIAKKEQHYN